MVRVSSFGQQQVLIRSIMDNQQDVFTAQRQIATGKRVEDYKELAGQSGTLLGSRSFQARVETYQNSIKTIDGKLQANDVQVGGVIDAMDKLKDMIQITLANAQAEGFGDFLEQTFQFTAGALNTNFDGTYLFSGAETGTKPVNVDNLADLSALASTNDAFDNSSVAFQAKIADGVDLKFGVLASDVGLDIFSEMVAIYDYTVGSGAIDGELTDAERAFLETRLATLDTAIDKVRQVQVTNGLNSERLEVVDNQHKDTKVFLETFIADIEDVDIAEAITRLNNDQIALEASYRAIGSLSQLSLLNFL
ncbi:MAG: hypothetical protein JKY34_00660 [Kordiimonadaceae bacterium]|nr:hypothetical protein [Kordiimonadaceae bacterium]